MGDSQKWRQIATNQDSLELSKVEANCQKWWLIDRKEIVNFYQFHYCIISILFAYL